MRAAGACSRALLLTRALGTTSVYTVYTESSEQSSGEKFSQALLNALVMVTVVAGMTFLMVLLYKMRCMKVRPGAAGIVERAPHPRGVLQVLYGLLMFTTLNALSYTLGIILYLAFHEYKVALDWFTFVLFLYNFGVVGVIAIFYQKGTSRRVTQGYLICVSVIIAFLLSFFADVRAAPHC